MSEVQAIGLIIDKAATQTNSIDIQMERKAL
jgi:hypothetical protein